MVLDGPTPVYRPETICLSEDQRSLRLEFGRAECPATAEPATGVIDVGEGGRLLGIEIDGAPDREPALIDIDPPRGALSRDASVLLTIERDNEGAMCAVMLPRRGAGYEITYPSGNQ